MTWPARLRWHNESLLFTIFRGTPSLDTAERLDRVLARIDLGAAVESDHRLLIPLMAFAVRYKRDHDSVVDLIYRWADAVDSEG